MKRAWIGGLIALAVVAIGAGGWYWARSRGQRAPLETVRVARGDVVTTASVAGTIEPHAQVSISSRISGEVVEVAVDEGQRVEEGALLFRLDGSDAARAVRAAEIDIQRLRAALRQTRAQRASASLGAAESETAADIARRGAELGVTSADAARQSAHAREVARVDVQLREAESAGTQAQLAAAELALEEARRNLERTEIRAPFAGTILSVDVERGSIVSSAIGTVSGGTTLATLADLTDLRVIGQLDEAQVGAVEVAQPVTFRVDAYPDRAFTGRVARVSPLGVQESSVVVFDVEIVVTDPDATLLRSGMSADAEIVTARHEGVLLVPIASLRSTDGRREVVLGDGTARPVVTGPTDGARIVVTEGLSEGEEVVADALSVAAAAPARASSGLLPGPPRSGAGRP
jgi:HlyD family secretion protein